MSTSNRPWSPARTRVITSSSDRAVPATDRAGSAAPSPEPGIGLMSYGIAFPEKVTSNPCTLRAHALVVVDRRARGAGQPDQGAVGRGAAPLRRGDAGLPVGR